MVRASDGIGLRTRHTARVMSVVMLEFILRRNAVVIVERHLKDGEPNSCELVHYPVFQYLFFYHASDQIGVLTLP